MLSWLFKRKDDDDGPPPSDFAVMKAIWGINEQPASREKPPEKVQTNIYSTGQRRVPSRTPRER